MAFARSMHRGSSGERVRIPAGPSHEHRRDRHAASGLLRAWQERRLAESKQVRSLGKSLKDVAVLAHHLTSCLHLRRKLLIEGNQSNALRTFGQVKRVALLYV